jgi:hypothetical protein
VTHNVVKFIVNVRLIENRVKSHVGKVMETKVISQYSIPGITFNMASMKFDGGLPLLRLVVNAVAVTLVMIPLGLLENADGAELAARLAEDPHSISFSYA